MRNVNAYDGCLVEMRDKGFILTMRNVNVVGAGRIYTLLDVLY